MPDHNPPQPDRPHPSPSPDDKVHERPEVKPLVDKAGAEPERRVPQGTMKTGADIPGGGGTKSLEMPATAPDESQPPPADRDED